MLYYDLHMHSCLSPCADELMTPNNIVNMAVLKKLQCISVTDHNSMLQQFALIECAKRAGIKYLIGVELQTKEEVHVLAYFDNKDSVSTFQNWIEEHQGDKKNNSEFFGEQLIMNDEDQVIRFEEKLLIDSLDVDINECVNAIHEHNGVAILAHAYKKNNGVITQLGFIPLNLDYDGIEVVDVSHIEIIKKSNPWVKDDLWLCNSDAHQLIDIHECEYTITQKELDRLRGVLK